MKKIFNGVKAPNSKHVVLQNCRHVYSEVFWLKHFDPTYELTHVKTKFDIFWPNLEAFKSRNMFFL